jgi:hypothetical protein
VGCGFGTSNNVHFRRNANKFAACRYVGQVVNLRPTVNRPNAAGFQDSSFAAYRYAARIINLIRLPRFGALMQVSRRR